MYNTVIELEDYIEFNALIKEITAPTGWLSISLSFNTASPSTTSLSCGFDEFAKRQSVVLCVGFLYSMNDTFKEEEIPFLILLSCFKASICFLIRLVFS